MGGLKGVLEAILVVLEASGGLLEASWAVLDASWKRSWAAWKRACVSLGPRSNTWLLLWLSLHQLFCFFRYFSAYRVIRMSFGASARAACFTPFLSNIGHFASDDQ